MVRENLPFRQAASECGVSLEVEKAAIIHRSRTFQQVLWQARFEFYTEIATSPTRTKAAALGLMVVAIQELAKESEWEKVLEGVLKLAKVEGWIGGDANVNVFANVTAKDIEAEKQRLLQLLGSSSQDESSKSKSN